MKRFATTDQIQTAISWLEVNDGEEGEAEACKAVISLLESIVRNRDRSALVTRVARASGTSRIEIRRHLRKKDSTR